jgi:cysteinyl-tRNA synthetase
MDIDESIEKALLDDLNTPIVIAQLFELARRINLVNDGNEEFSSQTIEQAKSIFKKYFRGILGIKPLSS